LLKDRKLVVLAGADIANNFHIGAVAPPLSCEAAAQIIGAVVPLML
jgi:hypothetical protein